MMEMFRIGLKSSSGFDPDCRMLPLYVYLIDRDKAKEERCLLRK
jgi:hypothetical protein